MNEPTSTDPGILQAYAHCAEVVRSRARNFYYGLRLTPEPRRSSIYAVYAWMRQADDEADAAGDPASKRLRLADFRERTERMLAEGPGAVASLELMWRAIDHTVRTYHIDPAHLRSMLDGLEFDLEHEQRRARPSDPARMICPDRRDLERYCYRVASTVGLVCLRIWGCEPGVNRAEADRLAVRRGLAFQLTNILRDYAEDFDEGRVYLPTADFHRAGLTPELLRQWHDPARCEAMVQDLASWARDEYAASAPLDRMVSRECYAALRTMTRIYAGLLDKIIQNPSRIVGNRRIRLQSAHKAGIALRAWARGWVNAHVPESSALHTLLSPVGRR